MARLKRRTKQKLNGFTHSQLFLLDYGELTHAAEDFARWCINTIGTISAQRAHGCFYARTALLTTSKAN